MNHLNDSDWKGCDPALGVDTFYPQRLARCFDGDFRYRFGARLTNTKCALVTSAVAFY